MMPTFPSKSRVWRRVARLRFDSKMRRDIRVFFHASIDRGVSSVNSFAVFSWQNQFFRKVCRDLKIDEGEETRILKSQTKVVRDLRKKLVSDRFD